MEPNRPKNTDYVEVKNIRYTFQDMHLVVDTFYKEVARDPILSVPFSSVKDWPHHIDRLTHFWWTRFGGRAYLDGFYNPIEKHYESGFNEHFLNRWLYLFQEVLQRTLSPEQSDLWALITQNMGQALSRNNEMLIQHRGPYVK